MRAFLFLIIVLLPFTLFAQQRRTISGYITDAQTGEQLYAATILDQNTRAGTTSNRFGFFSLSLPTGLIKLKISFVGYTSQDRTFILKTDTLLKIALKSDNKLDEVVVKGSSNSLAISNRLGQVKLSAKALAKLPSLMGEKDVMKSITILPGVQQGSEGSAGIFVRGGSPDQNLILLDDVPLFNVSHLFGFVSVFTPEAINSIDFYKGGFPARYGGRLSSVVDLRMKDGNKYKRETSINLGLISSQLTTEGPIKEGESSYFFSVRRTLLDLIFKGVAGIAQRNKDEQATPSYGFHDINGKVNYKLNESNQLYWSFYSGKDNLSFEYKDYTKSTKIEETQKTSGSMYWGNVMTALKLNSRLNSKLFLNTTLSGSIFNYGDLFKSTIETIDNEDVTKSNYKLEYKSQIRTIGLKTDLDVFGKSNLPFQIGLYANASNYLPGKQQVQRNEGADEYSSSKIESLDYGFYLDKRFNLGNKFSISIGLRNAYYSTQNAKTNVAFEPRINLTLTPNDNTSYMASYALMTQPIHLLSNGNVGLPTDIWVPSTNIIKPETSDIFSIGFKNTLRPDLKLSVEAYYKRLNNVISFTEGDGILDIDKNWEQKITSGIGRAWGMETELRHNTSILESWLGYTLSWNERKFEDINKNRWFPYQYDRRHKLDLGIIMKLTQITH